ncbi:DUF3488 and transglutaminase-like domain-containing protein [Sinomonas sp. JGH33]|uniref:DUF3488 and transglutaminase-like domain-containing protein n=1 Tax=Sinomonas terricola TaxID=3110330 RepID=A0ABU5TAL8_9MICC|nr:DUF3488 and transglutaminase-like domain-containing protein [Sinomonas sp. JGH33]MEA5456718.1 DUF3488 and transglutaminase-like domain-containing protein [Sinomonas sp. JGH33]
MVAAPPRPAARPVPARWRPRWDPRQLAWKPAAVGMCLAASIVGGSLSYDGVLRGWAWLYPIVVVVFATAGATAVGRLVRLPVAVPSAIGLVVWALSLTFMFLRDTALLGVVPTAHTLEAAREALDEAWNTVAYEAVPAGPNVGVVALLTGSLGLTALIGEAIAVACRLPVVAGIAPLSVLAVPALLKPSGPGAWGFATAAAAYLAALAIARADAAADRMPPQGSAEPHGAAPAGFRARRAGATVSPLGVVGIVAAIVTGALVLPALIPGFERGAFPEGSRLKYFGQNVGLNPFISLGSDLRSAQGVGIVRYATDSTRPLYLQTVTVDSFDGTTWGPDNRDDTRQGNLGAITPGTAQTAPLITTTTVISTGNFTSPYLPTPYAPASITGVRGSFGWDPLNLSVKGQPGASLDQNYIVRSVTPDVTPDQLDKARSSARGIGRENGIVPNDVPAQVRTTAETVTKGAASQYAKALAIQGYLRTFTYSEQAPVNEGYDGTGMDVLEKFLEKKSGYCIHFSAAMAVMARLVGIPSRIAVGFAPGHPTGGSVAVSGVGVLPEFEVDARDAHAWPELYFEGLGWIPFEPTPSRGVLPSYAQTDSPSGGSTNLDNLNEGLRPSSGPTPTSSPSATPTQVAAGPAESPWEPAVAAAAGALVLVALLVLPAAVRAAQRRRRLSRGVDGAWEELEAIGLDHGIPASPSDTPRTYAGRLAAWEADDGAPVREALATLTREYERHEYGRPGYLADDDATRAAISTLSRASRATSSPVARARIAALPPSAFARPRNAMGRASRHATRTLRRFAAEVRRLWRALTARARR